MAADDIPVMVKGLVPTPSGSGVFLSDGEKTIAIFVDPSVAASISMFMEGIKKPRPLTHDLMGNIFAGLGVIVEKVVVCDMQDDTFFARLHLKQDGELGTHIVEVDARPSDSIALAIQGRAPIFVRRAVWERAEDMTWALKQASEGDAEGLA